MFIRNSVADVVLASCPLTGESRSPEDLFQAS